MFLGPAVSPVVAWLREQGEQVVASSERLSRETIEAQRFAFLVSHGYRYILKPDVLELFPGRAINLHISYLPWNRGADPNFWSFVDGSPKGVTIHHLDAGVDTGDIIAQQELEFDQQRETLATTYELLQVAVLELFKRHWPEIKHGSASRTAQQGAGSSHKSRDKEALSHLLTLGWNTPVSALLKHAAQERAGTSAKQQADRP